VLSSKVINYLEYGLFYVRTVIEMHLHMFMAEEYIGVARQFPRVITHLKQYSVVEEYQRDKEQLIRYTEELEVRVMSLRIEHS
jgi:hypothetical protein